MLYANTDDGSSALWVCDGSGVVVNNISIYGAERTPILEQINEHYGTSFTGWSDNEIGLRLGDTLPNWNAYEKINGEFGIKIASHFTQSNIVFIGWLYEDIYHYYAVDEDSACGVLDTEGRYIAPIDVTESIQQMLLENIENAGYNVSAIQPDIIQLEIGQIVPNWNDYVVI